MSAASILLIDDERAIRVALRKCLEREGFKVDDCGDPIEGVKLAEKNGYGLVICDYQMPGMLGVDVLRRIKLLQPNTIRIILTAHAAPELVAPAPWLGRSTTQVSCHSRRGRVACSTSRTRVASNPHRRCREARPGSR